MSLSDFERALVFILSAEGGYANNKNDRGGETYKGIARNSNPHWSGWGKIDAAKATGILSHQELTIIFDADKELQTEIADLYKSNYWTPIRGDSVPWPVNCVIFDCAVNSGPHATVKILQHALTIKEDGAFGPVTLAEVGKWTPSNLAGKIIAARKQFYEDLVAKDNTQSEFLIGWMKRLDHLSKFISEAA